MSKTVQGLQAGDDGLAVHPSFREALTTWARIGVLSFGGPAGQIALMHKILIEEKKWIDEPRFLSALNFCMLLPGPEAMQLATYVGWRLHGVAGGLAAGLLFVIPGALVVLALSALYAAFGQVPLATALFVGVKAAVLAIVIEALMRVSKRALKDTTSWVIAGLAFLAIFVFGVPFPVIVLTAAIFGYLTQARPPSVKDTAAAIATPNVSLASTAATVALWLAIWIVPLVLLAAVYGRTHVLTEIAWFFSKLAVVTFGGAYAVLAYMTQDVVHHYGWLKGGEMLDGLGLAETTPGPLILVTEFVGFLAAYRNNGGGWGQAVLGAVVTLWATFAPCFLWIFAGAPYVERINAAPRLKAALAAITAAVVGVILNLTVWFGLNTLFGRVDLFNWGGIVSMQVPALSTLNLLAAGLAVLAAALLLVLHRGVMTTLAVCGALALLPGVIAKGGF